MFKRFKKILGRYRNFDQILMTPYRSYGTYSRLYVKGRLLDNAPLKIYQEQNKWRTLVNTYKQFDSFEIPGAKVELELPGKMVLQTKTDEEGYFLFNQQLENNISEISDDKGWVDYNLYYREALDPDTALLGNPFKGRFLIPSIDAEYGVISDIDDTILQTGVTSFLKWRLLKNSLMTNAYKRIPLKGAPDLYRLLQAGKQRGNRNPIFYLSNSPWNMYEYLKLFLDYNGFPKGPILLRDIKTPFDKVLKPEKPHKQKEILNILKTYPDLKFILIGDSGEHDATIYTDIAAQYSDRIMSIYLRSVNHKKHMRRVQSIIDNFDATPVLMVNTSAEAVEHARENGYIK